MRRQVSERSTSTLLLRAQNLNQVSPSVAGVDYAALTGFGTVPFGNLQLRITRAGSKDVIFDSPPQVYSERASFDIVVYTRGSATLPNVALLPIDSVGTGSIVNSLLAQYKVINASTVGSPLNVFFEGVLALSNIPFTGATGYQRVTAGQHSFSVQATATPGANLLSFAPTLAAAMDSSIILEGPAGALTATVLTDNNLPPVQATPGCALSTRLPTFQRWMYSSTSASRSRRCRRTPVRTRSSSRRIPSPARRSSSRSTSPARRRLF